MLKTLIIIYCAVVTVKTVKIENGRRRTGSEYQHRQGKLFSFNVLEENVSVDLQFAVPFLRIPVKKTVDSAYGMMGLPTININPASLALGGIIVIGSTVILPYLAKKYSYSQETFRYAKLLDNAEFSTDALWDVGQQMLVNSNGFGGCPLRLACWAAQKDIAEPRAILTQIINNKLLSSMVNSSAVEDAMISGIHGRSCSSYGPCPLQEAHVPMLMNNLAVLINEPDIY